MIFCVLFYGNISVGKKNLWKYIKRIFITVIDYGKRKERENIKCNLPNFMRINKYKS
jgi:hypothetical protein